jgi:myo-inositol-1-phosphate synthase
VGKKANDVSGAVGVWMVGARGSLATTTCLGAAALGSEVSQPIGLVTALAPFADVDLPAVGELVFGGHDIVDTPMRKRAEALADGGVFAPSLLPLVGDALDRTDRNVRPAPTDVASAEAVERIRDDLRAFRSEHALDRIVVVHMASTEAEAAPDPAFDALDELEKALAKGTIRLPDSSAYALAAFAEGCPFVNFTPSAGANLPALQQLATRQGVCHAGRDGKTGETLLKTALAPMFATRNLRVRSWYGANILGGGDGASLADPDRRSSKLKSKGRALPAILGYEPDAQVRIDYVEDMGEWKTAWDHVAFEGFLGTSMRLQFTWEGCDSALAAPLVLDLVRLVAAADAAGLSGPLAPLAFFFKDPVGTNEHSLERQYQMLCDWAEGLPCAGGR